MALKNDACISSSRPVAIETANGSLSNHKNREKGTRERGQKKDEKRQFSTERKKSIDVDIATGGVVPDLSHSVSIKIDVSLIFKHFKLLLRNLGSRDLDSLNR